MRTVGPPLILISAAIVGVLVSSQVRHLVVDGAANTIASGSAGMAASYLAPGPDGAIAVTDGDALDAEVHQRMKVNQVLAYRLHAPDGTLLYSASPAGVDASEEHGEAFETALAGGVGVVIVESADDPAVPADAGAVMKVYAPVARGDGEVIAVADIYKPYEPVAASVRDSVLAVWLVVGLGAVITAGSLGFVAERTQRQIALSERQVASLNRRLDMSLADLEQQSLGVLRALTAAVDAKDSYTARHSLGVTDIAHRIGETLQLPAEEMVVLERASLLHDIGKIGISEAILLKPSALTDEQFTQIKEHPETGARILETIPFLEDVVPIVRYHHERWDGSGYPGVLAGEDIPRLARVLSVADAFDAMTTDRPYRGSMPPAEALVEILRNAGTQFDRDVVSALESALKVS